jgi:UDP-sugar transporter A1/2/3
MALLLLTVGVVFVQLSNVSDKQNGAAGSSEAWMGFLAMLINSLSSGFAGIYFERLMKSPIFPLRKPALRRTLSVIIRVDKPSRSIWIQSIELGIFGLFFSIIMAIWNDSTAIMQDGFFSGYDKVTLFVIGMQACGGILVAMVVRYADSILKAFATSASIVLSSFITFGLLGQKVVPSFLMGAVLVIISVYIYAKADRLQMEIKRQ